MDLLPETDNNGNLSTKIYDKGDDSNFRTTIFQFLCDIHHWLYIYFVSQLIWYCEVFSYCRDFLYRCQPLKSRLPLGENLALPDHLISSFNKGFMLFFLFTDFGNVWTSVALVKTILILAASIMDFFLLTKIYWDEALTLWYLYLKRGHQISEILSNTYRYIRLRLNRHCPWRSISVK